jgi:hypothetical protein
MDPIFENTYQQLYTAGPGDGPFVRHSFGPNQPNGDQRVRAAIDKADLRLRRSGRDGLRSDAKVLLLLNFVWMVDVPLAEHGEAAYRAYSDADLESDVNTLVDAATARTGDASVSAHAMVDALSANWANLKLANSRLWGATPETQ